MRNFIAYIETFLFEAILFLGIVVLCVVAPIYFGVAAMIGWLRHPQPRSSADRDPPDRVILTIIFLLFLGEVVVAFWMGDYFAAVTGIVAVVLTGGGVIYDIVTTGIEYTDKAYKK